MKGQRIVAKQFLRTKAFGTPPPKGVVYAKGVHQGEDYGTPVGTPFNPYAEGEVLVAHNAGDAWGLYIAVLHKDGFVTFYCHLSKVFVKPGDKVKLDTILGLTGQSGQVTGPHIHFELRVTRKGPAIQPTYN